MKYSAARSDGESALRSEEVDMSLRCDGAIARDKLCTRRKRDRNWRTMRGASEDAEIDVLEPYDFDNRVL